MMCRAPRAEEVFTLFDVLAGHRRGKLPQIEVKTWCRLCGGPALLNLSRNYDWALRECYAIDDQPMVHNKECVSIGGWGFHWRLDDVLHVLFRCHTDPCWPVAQSQDESWYEEYRAHDVDHIPVEVLTRRGSGVSYVDRSLGMLAECVNRVPQSREELEKSYSQVWDHKGLLEEFDLLGYRPPFAIVRHRHTRERGMVLFQNEPRMYFGLTKERDNDLHLL